MLGLLPSHPSRQRRFAPIVSIGYEREQVVLLTRLLPGRPVGLPAAPHHREMSEQFIRCTSVLHKRSCVSHGCTFLVANLTSAVLRAPSKREDFPPAFCNLVEQSFGGALVVCGQAVSLIEEEQASPCARREFPRCQAFTIRLCKPCRWTFQDLI